jgi:3-dehydroquinate dehydratase/shikimate dehydrogenase
MICVSIGRSRHKHMLAEHRHLCEQGAKLVELRIDYISARVNIQRLLKDRPCPTIITVRREQDGGKYIGTEEARQTMLREAIANGVEYVDLEEDIAGQIPRFGKTKRIVSYHSFRNTPDNLRELHTRLAALDADIIKIATMANHPHDNLRVLEMMQESNLERENSSIAMCMGDIGTPSRILAGKYGAPFTYATFHHERALAPGQLSHEQMVNVYRYESIGPQTNVYGVVADPIGHSLSPQIHNAAFGELGINAVYVPFRVAFDTLGSFIEDVKRLDIRGLSVTIPHKEAIAKFLTKVDPAVKGIGAVSTVLFKGADIVGYNTDYKAAMDCLEQALGGGGPNQISRLKNKKVVVLGAGGVARAVMYGLERRGAKMTIASRTRPRASQLAETFGGRVVDWPARHVADAEIIINCTPVGMHPNVDESPYNKSHLKPSMIVFDTVYNPESTLLLKEARSRGCHVVTGVDMFIHQAALQFLLFTGREAPEALMRETLKRAIGPVRY